MRPAARQLAQQLWRQFDALTPFTQVLTASSALPLEHKNMIGAVMLRTRGNFYHLIHAYDRTNSVELVSWAARNLVELAVWARFVTSSPENCQTMWLDQLIDADEFTKAMASFARLHTDDETILRQMEPSLAAAKQAKAENGVPEKRKYKKVSDAAADIGAPGEYAALNKALSKLVHPTALSIMLVTDPERENALKNWAADIGINYADIALSTVVEFFRSKGIDVSAVDRAASSK